MKNSGKRAESSWPTQGEKARHEAGTVHQLAPDYGSGASRATVHAAGGGDVRVVSVVREDVESTGAAAGGATGEDVTTGIEVANTAVVVKDVGVAVSYFQKT